MKEPRNKGRVRNPSTIPQFSFFIFLAVFSVIKLFSKGTTQVKSHNKALKEAVQLLPLPNIIPGTFQQCHKQFARFCLTTFFFPQIKAKFREMLTIGFKDMVLLKF